MDKEVSSERHKMFKSYIMGMGMHVSFGGGHLQPDHVHMLISIPPKYSVSQIDGFIKGKSAIYIARNFTGHRKNFTGQHFWARGYYVSTVGRGEVTIREYIKQQE